MSAQASSGIAVTKFFEDAIRAGFHYQELANDFWTTYIRSNSDYTKESLTKEKVASIIKSKEFEKILFNNQYIDWFKIKTTVYTDTSKIDPITKMHPKTITYKAIPYKIHILKFVGPGVSIANVDWGRKARAKILKIPGSVHICDHGEGSLYLAPDQSGRDLPCTLVIVYVDDFVVVQTADEVAINHLFFQR